MRVFSLSFCVAVLIGVGQVYSAVPAPPKAPPAPPTAVPKTPPAVPAVPAAPAVPPVAAPNAPALKTDKDKISYCIGFDVGRKLSQSFKADGVDVDPAVFTQAIKEGLTGGKSVLTDEEMKGVMDVFRKQMMAEAEKKNDELVAKMKIEAAKNKKEGDEFLAANAKKPGVVTTKSGLQMKVLKEGAGDTPKASDTVKTHYHGTFIDGTVFDSSVERKEPVKFGVTDVIPGWTEALQLMKVGEKVQIVVPSDLAYGPRGRDEIGPNSTLVFEIELLGIEKPKKSALPEGLLPPANEKDK